MSKKEREEKGAAHFMKGGWNEVRLDFSMSASMNLLPGNDVYDNEIF